MRGCNTCQHVKGREIDRRLANGEPVAQVARDYELSVSSVHRHRVNCLGLGSSNEIKKEAAKEHAADNLKINAMQVATELWENSHRPKPTESVIDRQ